jgi:hypothetical protein
MKGINYFKPDFSDEVELIYLIDNFEKLTSALFIKNVTLQIDFTIYYDVFLDSTSIQIYLLQLVLCTQLIHFLLEQPSTITLGNL